MDKGVRLQRSKRRVREPRNKIASREDADIYRDELDLGAFESRVRIMS